MKKLFFWVALAISLGIGSFVFAAQDLCSTLQNCNFLKSENYYLIDFTNEPQFGPAGDCGGHVTVLYPDGKTQCIMPYEVWGETIVVGKNIHDMSFKLVDDILVSQNDSEWEDVLVRNGCSIAEPEPDACSPNHLNLCPNQTACEIVGGHWCNDACQMSACPVECHECGECLPCACPDCNCTCPECEECSECPECEDCNAEKPFVCPLVDKTFLFENSARLTNFVCEVGPGCRGHFTMYYGDLEKGPIYIARLPFECLKTGTTIAGLPCTVTAKGDLRVLGANIDTFHCYSLGEKTYCFPEEKSMFELNAKE